MRRVALHPRAATTPRVVQLIHVEFSRNKDEYRAELVFSGWREGRRSIAASGPNCEGVARATAVAISILLDPSAATARSETSGVTANPYDLAPQEAEPPTPTPESRAQQAAVSRHPNRADRDPRLDQGPRPPAPSPAAYQWRLVGTPSLTYGVTGRFGFAIEAGPALHWRRAEVELLGFVAAPDTTRDSVGSASIMLLGAHYRACFGSHDLHTKSLGMSACAQLTGALLRAHAKGYTDVEPTTYQPWLAVGPALKVWWRGRDGGWSFSAALPFPLTNYSYVISRESGGVYRSVYETPSWTAWFGSSLEFAIP
jgi:hypothetical protein